MPDHENLQREWQQAESLLPRVVRGLEKRVSEGNPLTAGVRWTSADREAVRLWHQQAGLAVESADKFVSRAQDLFAAGANRSVQRPRECIESLERIQIAANQLREQLYASEMRLTFSDSSSASTDRALIDWGLETTTANAEALEHVLTRPQRAGPEARWRSVMRQSTQNGFYRWLRESVKGSVRDLGRPERKNRKRDQQIPLDDTDSAEILALLDDTGLPKRQQEVLLAVVAGETVADAARRLGIKPSTARQHLHRARKKLKGFRG